MRTEVRLTASERGAENAAMNSALKGVLSRGVADRLQLAMGIAGSVFSVAILLMPVFAFAQGHAVVTPGQLVWKPLIPGVEMAVVSGDPDKKGGPVRDPHPYQRTGQSAAPLASDRRTRHGAGGLVSDGSWLEIRCF